MRFPYKSFPLTTPNPVTKQDFIWRPAIKVLLWYNHQRSAPLEAILDTGADHCFFNGEIGEALGVPVTKGIPVPFTGFVRDANATGFLHRLQITVAAQTFEAPIVFALGITTSGDTWPGWLLRTLRCDLRLDAGSALFRHSANPPQLIRRLRLGTHRRVHHFWFERMRRGRASTHSSIRSSALTRTDSPGTDARLILQ